MLQGQLGGLAPNKLKLSTFDHGVLRDTQVRADPEDKGPCASYPEYSRANSYPWSPFPPRWARAGPGPHSREVPFSGGRGSFPTPVALKSPENGPHHMLGVVHFGGYLAR